MSDLTVLDLFAGAGGFSIAAHTVTHDVWGIELDADAVASQQAAGMALEEADITALDPLDYANVDQTPLHLHASPPCQSFSAAGKGDGRKHLDALSNAAYDILTTGRCSTVDLSDVPEGSLLVLEPARWIHALKPESISLEQVRSVMPIWEAYERGLYRSGYSVWTKLLHSEQYGVPQTRVRAWLGASKLRRVAAPPPTHSKYHARNPAKLDAGMPKWVSMAEALGWGNDDLAGFPRRADKGAATTIDGVEYRARDFRWGEQPSFGLTEKVRSWTHMMQGGAGGEGRPRAVDQPAPTQSAKGTATVTDSPDDHWHGKENKAARVELASRRDSDKWTAEHGGRDNRAEEKPGPTVTTEAHRWSRKEAEDAPATTVQGDRAGTHARRVTVAEAAVLQGFPADFPFQGSKTSQFRQVGNSCNPAVSLAVLRSVI